MNARSMAAQTLMIALPLVTAWPDLVFGGLPKTTVYCQPWLSSSRVYWTPRYSIDRPVAFRRRSEPQILVALRSRAKVAVIAPRVDQREGGFLVVGSAARKSTPCTRVNGRGKPRARRTRRSAYCGRNRWKVSAGLRSRHRRSRNVSAAATHDCHKLEMFGHERPLFRRGN
jgi:hypothetical protein